MPLQSDPEHVEPDDSPSIKRVVGLRYVPEDGLPQVILKGSGPLAEALLQRRDRHVGPQVVRNEALLQSLYRLARQRHRPGAVSRRRRDPGARICAGAKMKLDKASGDKHA